MSTAGISGTNALVISHNTMRKAIGWVGMLLPFGLLLGNLFMNQLNILNSTFFIRTCCSQPYFANGFFKTSISHYYYSTVGELLTATLCTVALFMFCYNGHEKRKGEKGLSDKALTNLIGIAALGIVIFPTSSDFCITDNVRTFLSSDYTGYIHFFMAALFFVLLSVMSIVNFRRKGEGGNPQRIKSYNRVYLICGIAMLVCIVLIFIYSTWLEGRIGWLDKLHPVFSLEAIALIFFGISWLTKGRVDYYYIPKLLNLKKYYPTNNR
jgi:uncharacterized membrane protein YidH (DUF202 family)